MSRFAQRVFLAACLIALTLGLAVLAPAQGRSKRLVLKDGSYQSVTQWEKKGERVRYYSAERFEWEELPNSLIDWAATEKYNAELKEPDAAVKETDAEAKAERAREDAASPAVAPGLRLPPNGGVYLLDTCRGDPQLVELVQSGGELNEQRGRNILRAAINPLASSKQSIELRGVHAEVQAHVNDPVIYVNVTPPEVPADKSGAVTGSPRDLDQQPDRYRLVRVQSKKDVRVVGSVKISMIGKVSQEQSSVATTSQPLSGGWVKIEPKEKLTPGEYALVEMLGPKEMNLYVWDFGINPTAPQNRTAWQPAQPKPLATGTTESPVLNKRKKN